MNHKEKIGITERGGQSHREVLSVADSKDPYHTLRLVHNSQNMVLLNSMVNQPITTGDQVWSEHLTSYLATIHWSFLKTSTTEKDMKVIIDYSMIFSTHKHFDDLQDFPSFDQLLIENINPTSV